MNKLASKKKSMSIPTSAKLLVVMTNEEIDKNNGVFCLDNFEIKLGKGVDLLCTNLPKYPEYDRFKGHIFYSRNGRFRFRVSDVGTIREWYLYPSANDNRDGNSILFIWAGRDPYTPLKNVEHGSIFCDYKSYFTEAVIAEITSLYDINSFIEDFPVNFYKKRLKWILDEYFRYAFPFNIRLPRWLSE
ncbi:MAG: hypothetical protein QW350_04010 [Candidatus Aenigmatarchaeota archaeon]